MSSTRPAGRLVTLLSVVLGVTPIASGQIANLNNTTSTPIPGAGHDYIHLLSETVNPANGSVSLRIQLSMPKGRGITLPFSIGYDSDSVHHLEPGYYPYYGTVKWMPNDNTLALGGWSTSFPMLGSNQWEQDTPILTGYNDGTPIYTIYPCYYQSNHIFHDASGGVHALYLGSVISDNPPPGGCSGAATNAGGDAQAYGFLPTSQGNVLPTPINVYDNAGTVYNFASAGTPNNVGVVYAALPAYIEDRNGNKIIPAQSGNNFTLTDTLGRPVIAINGFGPSGSTNSITVGGLTYQVSWKTTSANFSVPSTWAGATGMPNRNDTCSGISQADDSRTVVSQITLPNGKAFTFYYGTDNPDPSFQNPYGLLSEIDYPTGGWVKYTWKLSDTMNEAIDYPGLDSLSCPGDPAGYCPAPVRDGCTYQYRTPVIASRSVGFGGSSTPALVQTFTYSTNWAPPASGYVAGTSWTQKNTSVNTTDNIRGKTALTNYAYSPVALPNPPFNYTTIQSQVPVEATTTYYDWGNTTTPLRTVNKTWYDQFNLASQQTILDNGQASKITYCYVGSNCVPSIVLSQLQEADEYDFGASSPTRRKVTQYQSFSNSPGMLLSSPCDQALYIPSQQSPLAETQIFYDGGTSLCGTPGSRATSSVSNLPNGTHDETAFGPSSTTSRGNVTKINKTCHPSCGYSITTYTYDETGQTTSMTDPCGNATCGDLPSGVSHTTTYSYADNYSSCGGCPASFRLDKCLSDQDYKPARAN